MAGILASDDRPQNVGQWSRSVFFLTHRAVRFIYISDKQRRTLKGEHWSPLKSQQSVAALKRLSTSCLHFIALCRRIYGLNCPFKSCSFSSQWKATPVCVLLLHQDLSKCSASETLTVPTASVGPPGLLVFVPASCFLSLRLSTYSSPRSVYFKWQLPTFNKLFPLSLLSRLFLVRDEYPYAPSSSLPPHLLLTSIMGPVVIVASLMLLLFCCHAGLYSHSSAASCLINHTSSFWSHLHPHVPNLCSLRPQQMTLIISCFGPFSVASRWYSVHMSTEHHELVDKI